MVVKLRILIVFDENINHVMQKLLYNFVRYYKLYVRKRFKQKCNKNVFFLTEYIIHLRLS